MAKRHRRRGVLLAIAILAALLAAPAPRQFARAQQPLLLGATTTTENSGLLAFLLDRFTAASGIPVHTIVQGTGAILRTAAAGDFDVVLVHDPVAERAFVDAGSGIDRRPVMHNDFLLVGPADDPADVRGLTDVVEAFRRIAAATVPFVSRGDNSGTHKAELRLWAETGLPGVPPGRPPVANWYLETGTGMGQMLNIAAAQDAYAITDRGTWLSFANRGALESLVSGDPRLINRYSVIRTNPANHPHIRPGQALIFADWLTGPEGQQAIKDFLIDGEPAFFPHNPPAG